MIGGFIQPDYYGYALLCGLFYSLIFLYVFRDYRDESSVQWFILAASSAGIWLCLEGIVSIISPSQYSYYVIYISRIVGPISTLSIFFFIIEYTKGIKLNYKQVLLFCSPLIILHTYVLLIPNDLFANIAYNEHYVSWSYNTFGYIHYGYIAIIHILSMGNLMIESILSQRSVKRRQLVILFSGYVIGVIPGFLTGIESIPPYLNLSLIGIIMSLAIFGLGIKKYSLFDANTITNPDFINKIEEGIITVNDKGYIADFNKSSCRILEEDLYIGKEISSIRNKYSAVTDALDSQEETRLETSNGIYNISSYSLSEKKTVLVFRDNTELYDEKEKLDLIRRIHARIFRHNIRNKMTVINGNAEVIKNKAEEGSSIEKSAKRLFETSEKIIEFNEKTSEINDVIETLNKNSKHNIEDLVEQKVNKINSEYSSQYQIDANVEDYDVLAHPMIGKAIYNIIENCVEHNQDPTVTIKTKQVDNDKVQILFSDDGDGIDSCEHAPLETGDISQLNHASSSGLWLIKWISEYASPEGKFDFVDTQSGTECYIELKIVEDLK